MCPNTLELSVGAGGGFCFFSLSFVKMRRRDVVSRNLSLWKHRQLEDSAALGQIFASGMQNAKYIPL